MPICIYSVSGVQDTDREEANPLPFNDPYVIVLGDWVRRLFCIWNRGYKVMPVIAVDAQEALQIALAHKHIKRAGYYRRFDDLTDRALAGEAFDHLGVFEGLDALINEGHSGRLIQDAEGAWSIHKL